jgi:hypothetical protein
VIAKSYQIDEGAECFMMQNHYRVSIPLLTVTRATIEGSEGHGVENNLQLENILRTRVESIPTMEGRLGSLGITTYLEY